MLICPEASSAQNSMAAVSADGSTVCALILRLNSSCSRSIALVVRTLRHWLGGMGEHVPVLVDRAALDRHAVPDGGDGLVEPRRAIDDEEFRTPQPAIDEVSKDSAPGLGALAAHALDREQHLLAVLAHAENDQQRDGGRLAVEPHAHHGAVEDQAHDRLSSQRAGVPGVPVALHLAPGPAHRVLADGP